MVAGNGTIEGDVCIQCFNENSSSTTYGLQMLNNGGGIFEANQFDEMNIFYTANAINIGSGVTRSWFRGRFDGSCLGN